MKILYISSADDKYGAPKSMIDMLQPLTIYRDIEPIVVASYEGRLTDFCDKNKIQRYTVRCSEFMVVGGSNIFRKILKHSAAPLLAVKYHKERAKSIRRICQQINLHDIDIIHTNVNRVDTGAILATEYGVPHIWHLREFGKEDYNCMSLIPSHIKYMNKHATAFIAISEAVKYAWVEKGLDRNKIVVINDGITRNDFSCKSSYRKSTSKPLRIVFCGLVSETKGQKILIDAVNMLPAERKKKVFIDFYGGGRSEYISKLTEIVRSYELSEQIQFKGYSNSLNKELATYDIGVVASRAEALGRVTVEYMYAGLFVIASDTGANPDILANGAFGMLYKQGSSIELKKALLFAMDSPEECKEIALLAKKNAEQRFGMEKSSSEVYKLYKSVMAHQKGINNERNI